MTNHFAQPQGELADPDDTVAHREEQSLQPRVHPELVEDIHHVGALRLHGDVHLLGYLPALQTLGESAEDLPLAGGEPLDGLRRLLVLLALAADQAQHLEDLGGREQLLPGLEPPDRVDYLLYGGGLVQHAGGAGLDRAGEPAGLEARAEDQRHYLRLGRCEGLDQLEAVPVGQGEVDDRYLRAPQRRGGALAHLGPRASLSDHLELRLPLEHEGESLTEGDVVLDEQNPGQVIRVVVYGIRPSLLNLR